MLLWVQAALAVNNVWVLLCLLSVQQAFYAINAPTRSAAIPRMLPGDQLPAANSLNMTVTQFGAIVGPLLAGVLLRWVDLSTLYLIDAVTCVAPIWATIRLSSMPPTGDGSAGKGFASVWDGFRYLAGNTVVLMSFVVDVIAMVFGMPRALFPQIAHQSFGGSVEGGTTMALLAAAMSAGAVAGGVFSGWLPPSGRRSCSRRRPTTCAAGCRGRSSSSSPVARGWPTPRTAPPRPSSTPRSPRPGEGRSSSSES